MILDLNFVYQALEHTLPAANAPVVKISTDSRQTQDGCVFFALQGERFDAHDFVADVLAKNPLAVVVRADFALDDARLIKVENTQQALADLAHAWRMAINPKVFGITGSSGKTTVKEMLTCILRFDAGSEKVWATQGNFNNEIGLPLTLLQLTEQHQYAVIEMGMNHFGELSRLTRIACPDVALVNNAQRVHIGCGFDGVADIAKAKSEIYEGLSEAGIGIYPAEDQYAEVFKSAIASKTAISFGLSQGDTFASEIKLAPLSSEFVLHAKGQTQKISLPVAGRHNVSNALAAVSLALQAGISLESCAKALESFQNIKGRLQQKVAQNGAKLIDDTYNANPDSMRSAIDVLVQFPAPRILVMGDLGELGDTAPQLHAEVGDYARVSGVTHFFTLGELSKHAAKSYGASARHFADVDALVAAVRALLNNETTVLVKGSRFMKMERVVEALTAPCGS